MELAGLAAVAAHHALSSHPALPQTVAFASLALLVLRAARSSFSSFSPRRDPFVVVISGCDSGFGQLLALRLAELSNCTVFAGCLTQRGMDEARRLCPRPNLVPSLLDVTKAESVKAFATFVGERTGGKVDVIVNNAGTAAGSYFFDFVETKHFKQAMDVNFFGVVEMTKQFLPLLKNRAKTGSRPRVINIASMLGRIVIPGASAYCASKFAVVALCDALRREMVPFNIDVTCVEPGFMNTKIVTDTPAVMKGLWDAAPQEIRDQYGEGFIEEGMRSTELLFGGSGNKGILADPKMVVDQLFEACSSENSPPVRMKIGYDYLFAFYPMSLLSLETQDFFQGLGYKSVASSLPVPSRKSAL